MPRFNSDLLPDATGRDLGNTSERWDGYFQNIDISGAVTGGFDPSGIPGPAGPTGSQGVPGAGGNPRDRGFVNVMNDYNTVVGDGTTDDGPAIQAIIDANPSKWIFFPTMAWSSTGATPTSYKSNQRLVMKGEGQVLFGPTPVKRLGGTKIKFASGIGGILAGSTYNNQGVMNLFLEGGDAALPATIGTREDYISLAAITNLATSGIELAGSSPWVEGCRVSSFKGHGIEVYGSSGGQPDFWSVKSSYLDFNRGFGLFVAGTDANVGSGTHLSIEGNNLGGIFDAAFYGNTYNMVHTSQNASTLPAAGTNKTISSIVVASNVATITTSTGHGWSVGQWITTAPTDGTFVSTGRLLTASGSTATYNFTKADSSTGAGGTAATSTGTQLLAYYNAAGIVTGPYSLSSTGGGHSLNTPYAEGNQSASTFSPTSVTLNQQGATLTSATTGHHMYGGAGPSWFFHGGHWIFRPMLSGDLLILRNVANDTNMFTVDVSGNVVAKGTAQIGSVLAPTGTTQIALANAKEITFDNAAGNARLRGIYMHTDNILRVGPAGGTIVDTTVPIGINKIKSGASSNTDICGTIAISASTTGTYTFAGTYATAPIVTVTPISDPTAVGVWWVSATTTTITITLKTSGTITFNYTCVART